MAAQARPHATAIESAPAKTLALRDIKSLRSLASPTSAQYQPKAVDLYCASCRILADQFLAKPPWLMILPRRGLSDQERQSLIKGVTATKIMVHSFAAYRART